MLLVVIPLVVIILAMVFGYFLPSWTRQRRQQGPLALASFGRNSKASLPPRPVRSEPPPARESESFAPPSSRAATVDEEVRSERVTSAIDAVPAEGRARAHESELEDQRRVLRLQVAGDPRRDVLRDHAGPSTLRLEKPVDGTLQFLPGKLEVLEGRDVGQEIRFVKTAGPDGQTITFGRAEGAQYRHVQLEEHTVSRQHAKMALDGKTWTLTNMSRTNPVTVNGLSLGDEGAHVVLRDGDRIEMGEVVFRFRAR